jgi:hypothetical protein
VRAGNRRASFGGSENRVALTVVCDEPEALAPWLTPELAAQVRLRRRDPLHEIVVPDDGSALLGVPASPPPEGAGVGHVLRLRLDGPEALLPLVARYLHRELGPFVTVTAIVAAGVAIPPPADVLVALAAAGLVPGIDLTACRWVGPAGVWVLGPAGPAVVPAHWRRRCASRDLARLLGTLVPVTAGSPVARWLDRVAGEAQHPARADWDLPVQALYLDAVLGVPSGRGSGPGRSRWPSTFPPAIIGSWRG